METNFAQVVRYRLEDWGNLFAPDFVAEVEIWQDEDFFHFRIRRRDSFEAKIEPVEITATPIVKRGKEEPRPYFEVHAAFPVGKDYSPDFIAGFFLAEILRKGITR